MLVLFLGGPCLLSFLLLSPACPVPSPVCGKEILLALKLDRAAQLRIQKEGGEYFPLPFFTQSQALSHKGK